MTQKLLMGNEAFAHAALEAGVAVVAGYPGTPSSELIETVARLHAEGIARGVHVEWSTNEKAALELLAGASMAGARCLFTCKQVGLNVASDALMSLNYVGVRGGLVLFVADDPGPISSQTEQDTRRFGAFAKVPVLDPSTPEECFAMMKAAFDLSERYGTPVIVRPTTRICHASTFFDVVDATDARPVPAKGFEKDSRWVIFPKRAFEAHGEINDRLPVIAEESARGPLSCFNTLAEVPAGAAYDECEEVDAASYLASDRASAEGGPRIGVIAGGVSSAYAREALDALADRARRAGVQLPAYRFLQVGTPYPFPEALASRFMTGLDAVCVYEELDHVLGDELCRVAGRAGIPCRVVDRTHPNVRDRGENGTEDAMRMLAWFFGEFGQVDTEGLLPVDGLSYSEALPARPPVLCAGCPHRQSFYAVKRALSGRDAVLCGDIGCYTLGNAAPLDAVDTCLCMGAGITMAQGLSVVEPGKKHVAFVGDSTFFASGLTGIANAVYNGHDITVCVLDNATTAMTGSQPHPGTGVTLMGEVREPIDIEGVLRALGVTCIVRDDLGKLDATIAAARAAIDFNGPSAVIFRSPCVQLSRPDAPALIDAGKCTGCKKCIAEIGCPGIGFDVDAAGPRSGSRGQAFVDASLCTGCGLCADVCPFGAITCRSHEDDEEGAAR